MNRRNNSRRGFFVAAVTAGGGKSAPAEPPDGGGRRQGPGRAPELEPPTENNIEGPYYRPGAPFRDKLYNDGEKGDVIEVSGVVVAQDGAPVEGAVLEVWNTTAFGHYDNGDPDNPPANDEFHMRGRVRTDRDGRFRFETIRPGHYAVTPTEFRTAHVHFIVTHADYQMLTSQFFFKGERYNKTDAWFKPSMVLDLRPVREGRFAATFRIVLARA